MLRAARIWRYRLPKILFFGGDDVSVVCLDSLVQRLGGNGTTAAQCLEVVAPTAPAKLLQASTEGGASPHSSSLCSTGSHHHKRSVSFPVVQYCRRHGITCHVLDHPSSIAKCTDVQVPLLHQQSASRFDLAVVASFRYFLPSALLRELPPCINMHPSLLPKYRGASPIFSTVLRGEVTCGASIIKLSPGELMDSGDILLQRTLAIRPEDDMRTIFPAVTRLGAACLLEVVFGDHLEGGGEVETIEFWNNSKQQQESAAGSGVVLPPPMWSGQTFSDVWSSAAPQTNKIHFKDDPFHAPVLDKNSSNLRFDVMSGLECHNLWRAFAGGLFFKPAHCVMLKQNLTPAVRQQLIDRVRKSLARRRSHCDLGAVSDADVLHELTVTFTVVEALHPQLVSASVIEELARKVGPAGNSASVPPGSAYFPKTDSSIAAIACCGGNGAAAAGSGGSLSWFFWKVGTLKSSTPQCCDMMRKGLALQQGVIYERLFAPATPVA